MSITLQNGPYGRLGNQIFRNLAVSFLAKKNNLSVDYSNKELMSKLGIQLYSGDLVYDNHIVVDENNYLALYNGKVESNVDANNAFFQTKEISKIMYDYLRDEEQILEITRNNGYRDRYRNNNDVFIHVRLGDAERWNPGVGYYLSAIFTIVDDVGEIDTIYISTDDTNNDIIKTLLQLCPQKCKVFENDEISTIQFGSTCKYVILSHGSFSAITGYLSFYSTVIYPKYEHAPVIWFGDMFSIPGWIDV
jgi:hypothetical protein